VKDDLGRDVSLKKETTQVMALSSSITEMLYLICKEENIVGRTQNCDYPPQALKKPVINNYPIDYEGLLMLKPDLVIAKDGIISIEQALKIEEMGIPIYFQKYRNVEDVFLGLEKLGQLLNSNESAKRAADSLRNQLQTIQESVAHLTKPKVLLIISKDKIFVYGKDSFGSDMLLKAGGINAIDTVFANSFPQVTSEYILHINPDIIIGAEQVKLSSEFFELYPELKKTYAYENKRIYTIAEDLISRPGPRVVMAIDQLKTFIHPNAK
jgi:iron complex transport system substrate-binding protein